MPDAEASTSASSSVSVPTPQSETAGPESIVADVDTCRICRGEQTPGEPLFYPCKCSGSIKYVHQDCLMEWLSHSQKKHCELCKTPFRFTKLYSPNMPKRLPFYVFASHMAKYLFRNILVWLRAALVTSVWLGWLPYLMRKTWSFLFWLSDEGFGQGPYSLFEARNSTAAQLHAIATAQGLDSTTCPSSPLYPATTTAASKRDIAERLPNVLRALGQPLNVTASNTFVASIARFLFGEVASTSAKATKLSLNTTQTVELTAPVHSQHSSLLGDVGLLKNLTRHPGINRTVIAVLEGQIITILVIVCFILIILVRDYVVQQQPEINMRAAFAQHENNVNGAPIEAPHPELRGPDSDTDEGPGDNDSVTAQYDDREDQLPAGQRRGDMVDPHDAQLRTMHAFRPRLPRTSTHEDAPNGNAYRVDSHNQDQIADLLQAAPGDDSQSTVHQYLRIYRQAGGDHQNILRIIREEGLDERLAYWVSVTQEMLKMANESNEGNGDAGRAATPPVEQYQIGRGFPTTSSSGENRVQDDADEDEVEPTTMWARVCDTEPDQFEDLKGKGKATDEYQNTSDGSLSDWESPWASTTAESQWPSAHRPRAVSDGPQRHEAINPLANNSWSFANLPANGNRVPADTMETEDGNWKDRATESNPFVRNDGFTMNGILPGESAGALTSAHGDDHAAIALDDEAPEQTESSREEDAGSIGLPDTAADPVNEDVQTPPVARQPAGLVDRVAEFMWRDVEAGDADGAEAVHALELFVDDEDAPFADALHNDEDDDDVDEMDAEVVEAAVAAGIDPEALEDAEDFDGIMELIGMRGPIAGLFQNAIFCGFLVSISIFLGIFIPYNLGRLAVWVIANPTRILHMIFSFSKFVQDLVLMFVGWTAHISFGFLDFMRRLFRIDEGASMFQNAVADSKMLSSSSFNRIMDSFMSELPFITASEMRNFSAISHEALISVKGEIHQFLSGIVSAITFVLGGNYASKWTVVRMETTAAAPLAWDTLKNMTVIATQPSSWVINLDQPESTTAIDPVLAYWGAKDRTLAILGGYLAVSIVAGLYLGRGTPFSSSQTAQDWEASVIDALNQASGVMKVILIISIEMLIFPLYCGLLLDFALLPLFEGVSLKSRLLFTYNYPLTSIFVHWFVGTGYMFHFALFVSMCRKIMRKGVLYFIRDPDDPEFHPVRDVLERTVTTQLRKILFSAFVYGALVVICLGGVVWSLSLALPHVLPIHYSSNEPVLEFPIDLLFYNFCMPLAVKFFKPSEGLSLMYSWWFRRCARALRLTWFLFGDRRIDEEGILVLADEEAKNLPWYRKIFLELREDSNTVAPTSWTHIIEGHTQFKPGKDKPAGHIPADKMIPMTVAKRNVVESGQLIPNGRFVHTPASDQVKIPKGHAVFHEFDERDISSDGSTENITELFKDDKHYQFVYIPPHFRLRIFLFILSIWLFAAITGVSFTIVPLVFGRRVFKALIPAHIRTNDVYAFSIGVYILGSLCYASWHTRLIFARMREWAAAVNGRLPNIDSEAVNNATAIVKHAAKLAYTYITLLVVFPLLVTLLVELYILMPIHAWKASSPDSASRIHFANAENAHTIRVIQAWTLGLLYLKLGARALTLCGGRPAQAVRAVFRRGWTDPDVAVLTRAFVLPGLVISLLLIFVPPSTAHTLLRFGLIEHPDGWGSAGTENWTVSVFRYSYPVTASIALNLWILSGVVHILAGWKARVRDEAYLIGERLHNFQVITLPSNLAAGKGTRNGAWRNGARL
ncbi:uncharacterized protein BCR38DRAFT_351590 [Pseudomassariella vexata]|uniref:RING-type E3 ubiquitin transferase n=1 Tax=Pseudomassariella vexata TaxID=1141098 RepID=A0A1Y2DJ27_9PEZI|nr:uncharacterized protein BCR38DRAFT_351590 [Pseudomassariella vexata]ORY59134.1 hypothetical protein BCR38DRAFT_351590 [Pseudomassariella vexata]